MPLKHVQFLGETIGGFRVLELIGQGAMSAVYRALDTQNREVALKIPDPRFAHRAEFTTRFVREAQALALLRHPGIVQVYTVEEHEGIPILAMQYVRGGSLAHLLAHRERIELAEALEYVLHICEGIEYAHSQGIIHHDLKPSNILIDGGRALVVDFGISKIISSNALEDALTFVGTPLYMSPEQCGEGVPDLRTDIYSLGVVFYEMLYGKAPFTGETPAEVIRGHLLEALRFPKNEDVPLPPKIVKIIRKMLAKDPRQRYGNAADVAADVRSYKEKVLAAFRVGGEAEKNPSVVCHVPQRMLLGAVTSALQAVKCSYEVIVRSQELIDRLDDGSIDAVILGTESYDTAIYRTAERIRKESRNPGLRVLLVSAGISKEEVQKAFASGVHDIIAEPYNHSILVAKLESILRGGQQTIESRRFFRIPFSGRVTMRIDSEIIDISEGGMRVLTNMAIKAGEIVTFEVEQFRQLGFGEKSGKVVWVSGNDTSDSYAYQAGIDFIDLTDMERTKLRRWIFELHASSRK